MNTKHLVRAALIAAIYATVSVLLAPISYGAVQVRISEALTLLPILSIDAVWGVTLGCFLANLIGMFTGANILGPLDVVLGTAATLAAAVCTRKIGKKNLWLATLPPIILNAAVVGGELAFITGAPTFTLFCVEAAWVGLGQAAACIVLGVPLVKIMAKTNVFGSLRQDA